MVEVGELSIGIPRRRTTMRALHLRNLVVMKDAMNTPIHALQTPTPTPTPIFAPAERPKALSATLIPTAMVPILPAFGDGFAVRGIGKAGKLDTEWLKAVPLCCVYNVPGFQIPEEQSILLKGMVTLT